MRQKTKTWANSPNPRNREITPALAAGFQIEFDDRDKTAGRTTPDNPPHYHYQFKRGKSWIWSTKTGYMTAELIDGRFCNHEPYGTITGALNRFQ